MVTEQVIDPVDRAEFEDELRTASQQLLLAALQADGTEARGITLRGRCLAFYGIVMSFLPRLGKVLTSYIEGFDPFDPMARCMALLKCRAVEYCDAMLLPLDEAGRQLAGGQLDAAVAAMQQVACPSPGGP